MKTHATRPTFCVRCGYMVDHASNAFGRSKPEPGDYSLCLNCGGWLRFRDDMTLEVASTAAALDGLPPDRLQKALTAQAIIIERGPFKQGHGLKN